MADAVGAILLAGITLYAVLGGADFGGGLWDLLAGTTARGRAPRLRRYDSRPRHAAGYVAPSCNMRFRTSRYRMPSVSADCAKS